MKKFAASLVMAAILAVTGFSAPANAAPKDRETTTSTSVGWWP